MDDIVSSFVSSNQLIGIFFDLSLLFFPVNRFFDTVLTRES